MCLCVYVSVHMLWHTHGSQRQLVGVSSLHIPCSKLRLAGLAAGTVPH